MDSSGPAQGESCHKPVDGGQRYIAGLDGLRAIAVLAVVAYHVGFGWAQGGLLGVGIFFTLSGYLITDLLLAQRTSAGGLRLLTFWQRRARRLLPALFVVLAVVAAWVALLQRAQLPSLRGAMAAAAGYVSNWWLIAQNSSYFARFGPPIAARPSVVARGGGAVLPDLAVAAAARAVPDPRAGASRQAAAGWRPERSASRPPRRP